MAGQIIFDLADVSSIDARGLGALVDLQRWATNSGRTLRIVDPSRRVRELIAITNLHSVLDIEMSAPKRGAATIRGTRPNIGCLPLAICAADI